MPSSAYARPATEAPAPLTPQVTPDESGLSALGNQAAVDQLLSSGPETSPAVALPSGLDLQSAGLSFRLPGGVALTADWNQLQTTAPTSVWITLTASSLTASFSPPLEVDAQWPASNVAWSGFTWDFASASLTRVGVESTQLGFSVTGTVRDAVAAFVQGIVTGSPLARPHYDPRTDTDLSGTLASLQEGFLADQTQPAGDLTPAQVDGFGLHATLQATTPFTSGTDEGRVTLGAGATLGLDARVVGTGATVLASAPSISSLHVTSSDLVVSAGGKPVARLRSLRIDRGGAVDVTDFEPLGTMAELGAGESLLRLFVAVVALQGGDRRALGANLQPELINGLTEAQLEQNLTAAVIALIHANHAAIPGLDLRTVLGVAPDSSSSGQASPPD